MDAGGLHKLAKVLRQVGAQATSDPGESPTGTELLVATELFQHAPTTISQIAHRTGVVQSQVSAIVAQMREAGMVTGRPDPTDRRRTLLDVTAEARQAYGHERGLRSPEEALRAHLQAAELPHADQDIATIMRLLDELAARLGTA